MRFIAKRCAPALALVEVVCLFVVNLFVALIAGVFVCIIAKEGSIEVDFSGNDIGALGVSHIVSLLNVCFGVLIVFSSDFDCSHKLDRQRNVLAR
jgi:hypothetical protein